MLIKTYAADLKLFQELGLEPFATDKRETIFVGEYKLPNYENNVMVKIWVTCFPAQLWEFEVETDDGDKFNIKAGTGNLSSYWDSVLKVAKGLFVVTKLSNKKENFPCNNCQGQGCPVCCGYGVLPH